MPAITFAGPTAGDMDFATYSDTTFASSSGSVQRVTTSFDIVPLFWNANSMAKVPGFYTRQGWVVLLVRRRYRDGQPQNRPSNLQEMS